MSRSKARKKRSIAYYRDIKKRLNPYVKFKFDMPRKGRDFTREQKISLSLHWKRLKDAVLSEGLSWIPYPEKSKLPRVDGVRTNKGLFYKYPGAKAVFNKRLRQWQIAVRPKYLDRRTKKLVNKIRELLFLFPPRILGNPDAIVDFIEKLKDAYKPDTVRWSTKSRRESVSYDPELFKFYFGLFLSRDESEADERDFEEIEAMDLPDNEVEEYTSTEQNLIWRRKSFIKKMYDQGDYYNGVFLTWYKE